MRVLVGAAAGALAACSTPPPATFSVRDYPGHLLPPAALGRDVLLEQRVTAHWGQGEQRGFDAVVQKQGDVLTVLGLSPLGSVGFVIRMQGEQVELENHAGIDVPFPPRFVLLDVQRTFFPWLQEPPPRDGMREGLVGDERVAETWADGRLLERRFARLDGEPAGTIAIGYTYGDPARQTPTRVALDNGWLGYRLTIETHTERGL